MIMVSDSNRNKLEFKVRKRTSSKSSQEDPDENPTRQTNQPTKADLDKLLNTKSAKEMESKRIGEEIEALLGTQTIKEKCLAQKFRSNDAVKVGNSWIFVKSKYNVFFRNSVISRLDRAAQILNVSNFIFEKS